MSAEIVVKIQLDASQVKTQFDDAQEQINKLCARRDRWRKRAEDAESKLSGQAVKIGVARDAIRHCGEIEKERDKAMMMLAAARNTIGDLQQVKAEADRLREDYAESKRELDAERGISMDLGHILDAACRQFGNIARADLPGRIEAMRDALNLRIEERDAALRDLDAATAKVVASARVRDALMRENGELRAELAELRPRADTQADSILKLMSEVDKLRAELGDARRKALTEAASSIARKSERHANMSYLVGLMDSIEIIRALIDSSTDAPPR